MKAIDVANYTTIPTPGEVACLKADGYGLAIVGASYGQVAHSQLQAFLDGGLEIEAYAWVSFGNDWQRPLDRALTVIADLPVKRLWLDCEEEPKAANTTARIIEALAYVRVARPDLAFGIYTGGWWWKPNTGDWQGMSHLPLWTADYRAPSGVPAMYGGWKEAAIWQHAGSVDLCGLNSDDNVVLETRDRMYTDEQIDAMVAEVIKLGVRNQTRIGELANGIDAVSVVNKWPLSLKGLWYVAGKAWPF